MFLVFWAAKSEVSESFVRRFGRDSLRGEELSNEGCLDLGCLGHPVASFLEQRGDPGAGCPFEDAAEKVSSLWDGGHMRGGGWGCNPTDLCL